MCTRVLGPETDCDDPVALAFMGAENVDFLNRAIVQGVHDRTEGQLRIAFQSQSELAQIMRSVYLTEAVHLPGMIREQVSALNATVLEYAIPNVIQEAQMHAFYMRDRDQRHRQTMPRSVLPSKTGSRTETPAVSRPFFHPADA